MKSATLQGGWREALRNAARAFRLGMEGEGSEQLTRLIDLLVPVLGALHPDQLIALNAVLGAMLQGQARKDFLLVADLLEYEVAPFLDHRLS